jgi:GT2 family glycosyltransferase
VPRVSVIVPIFNGTRFLPTFFASLLEALPEDTELFLVDDGSEEPVWDTVPEFPSAAVFRLQNETNLGYSVAVNRGFAAASGDIVVQLNTDLVLEPECIRAMVGFIEREDRVGIVGSKLVFPTNGLTQHVGMAVGDHTKPHIFFQLPAAHPLCGKSRELQIMAGTTVAMTHRVLTRLGPLDERYFNHNEDIEHCLLASKHGLRNFVCADSVAHHWESQSGPSRYAQTAASDAIFWSKWGPHVTPDLGEFVDEGLDHVLNEAPHLADVEFHVVDLSRDIDQTIVLERILRRWTTARDHVNGFRQMNNRSRHLWLPLLLPHWYVAQPTPFIYLVDGYRELEQNVLWFQTRRKLVAEEIVVDLSGAAVRTSELFGAT